MAKRREIRNSTAEFLIFQIEGKEHGIEVYYKDKTVWCTQKAMGVLFDCTSDNISVHYYAPNHKMITVIHAGGHYMSGNEKLYRLL